KFEFLHRSKRFDLDTSDCVADGCRTLNQPNNDRQRGIATLKNQHRLLPHITRGQPNARTRYELPGCRIARQIDESSPIAIKANQSSNERPAEPKRGRALPSIGATKVFTLADDKIVLSAILDYHVAPSLG